MRRLYFSLTLLCCALALSAQVAIEVPAPTSVGLLGCEDPTLEGNRELELSVLGTYRTGIFDEGAAEIVSYDAASQRLFFSNSGANTVTILDISNPAAPAKVSDIDLSMFGGGINSVAVYNGIVATSLEAETVDGAGMVAFFDTDGNLLNSVSVGVLPDMILFSPDGTKVLTANEGEPSDDYLTDPEGSVSIIDISGGVASATVTTVTFEAYNNQKVSLLNKGIRLFGPNATVAQDLEPEYITITEDSLAYVGLQENNAFAVININTGELLDLLPLGYKDNSDGRPVLNSYVINELIQLPELGTPTYEGGQPTVSLGGFSGLTFDESQSTETEYVFYAIPDRGPNEDPVNRNAVTPVAPRNLRPYKLPDYQSRIAKFTLNIETGAITLDEQILLTRQDGTTPITGKGNIPGFDEVPVVPTDAEMDGSGDLLSVDFEDQMAELSPFTAFSVTSNENWEYADFNDNYFAQANGFGADEASDDWLVSPRLDLSAATEVFLSFNTAKNFNGGDFQVLVSDQYSGSGSPAVAEWTDLTAEATLSSGGFAITPSGEIDISAFAGMSDVYVAFRYISTGTGGGDASLWQVDDIRVSTSLVSTADYVDGNGRGYDALSYDPYGGDFEGIQRDTAGNFWACDENRPAIYQFAPNGTLIERYVPMGTSLLGTTPQPAGFYGAETLPEVYSKRRANRGFEALAYDPDAHVVYAFIQSPLNNPSNSVQNNTDVIRILAVDATDGTPVAEYVYLLENNRANNGFALNRVDKIGDADYIGGGKFIVLERDATIPGQDEGKKYIFEIDLLGATNILELPIAGEMTGMTLEQMSADELATAGIQAVAKTKVVNLPSIGYLPSDKPEGLAQLPNGAIAVINDNDFGLAGAGVTDNSILGIIEFCDDNSLDPSNRDDAIAIQNVPTLGMYMPDAIASYSVGGRSYIVTANEGDSRDYDGFSEEERVADVTLDPTAFPDAATLQLDENLGRLQMTTSQGDLDGDGDFDRIYNYGARSFSIFDRYGNLVFDSGNEFERIVAAAFPADFNSNNDENDSFDARSDDKGPEPEAVTIVAKNDTIYALIGLERVGGILVYNITDPTAPYFVNYVNNRNFAVDAQLPDDSTNPEVGDLGIEDIIYISAAESPTGSPLVVTANEVSGTVTLFGVEFDKAGFRLRIVHNNDGESKIVPDTLMGTMVIGGAAQFKTVADQIRAGDVPSITLSSGDNFLPGPAFNASLNRAEGLPFYDAIVIDEIGYDALAIGNHDFDAGPDVLAEFIQDVSNTMPTYLSANLDFSQEPNLLALVNANRIAPRTIIERDGMQIGVIGLTTPLLPTISSPRNVTVDDMLALIVQEQVMMLQSEGVDKIILISHLQALANELELIGQISGVDIVIAGGGDELLTNNPDNAIPGINVDGEYPLKAVDSVGDTVYVVTTPGEYRYVGNLVVEFDEAGDIFRVDAESDVILVKNAAADPTIQTMVTDSILAYTQALAENIIAITEVDLDGSRESVRTRETNQGNLIADAFLWLGNRVAEEFGIDTSLPLVAVQNGGGMRDDEIIPANSEISELKTFDILPFDNLVSILDPITPAAFKSALENSVSNVEQVDGRFLQIAGFSIIWDTAGVAGESRIFEVTLDDGTKIVENYQVVDGAPMIHIVTNSFTAGGGDSFDEFAALSFVNIAPSYQRALFEYLIAEDGVNRVVTAERYPAGGEGRIQQLQEVATDELNLADYDFGVSPNPFPGAFNVNYRLADRSEVQLTLFDLTGRAIHRAPTQVQGAGTYRFRFAPEGTLPNGIYLLRVRIDDRVGAVRLVKQ